MNLNDKIVNKEATICIIGLGYVGLPLAVAFGKKGRTLGFDMSEQKVEAYRQYFDPTGEVSSEDLRAATHKAQKCATRQP